MTKKNGYIRYLYIRVSKLITSVSVILTFCCEIVLRQRQKSFQFVIVIRTPSTVQYHHHAIDLGVRRA